MQIEPYEKRCEMAVMHDEFKRRLENAYEKGEYVEASWLCYAIFEQRIQRLIEKHIRKCPRPKRNNNAPVSISTKIKCIRNLSEAKYGGYENFDIELLDAISKWCTKRNSLVHSLLDISTYRQYDKDFRALAESGIPLVERLYSEVTKVRNWYYEKNFGEFPIIKCKCKTRCIIEGCNK